MYLEELASDIIYHIDSFTNALMNYQLDPYLQIINYILYCVAIQIGNQKTKDFLKRFPASSYVQSMLMCFSGELIAPLIIGEMPIKGIQIEELLMATIVW